MLSAKKNVAGDAGRETMSPLIVTAAIICHAGRFLVTQRLAEARDGGLWEFPGGKVEPGEAPVAALQRELLEELDLPVTVGDIFDVVYHHYAWGAVLILAYHCTPAHTNIRTLQVAAYRWLPPGELATLPFLAADRPLIERLQRRAGLMAATTGLATSQ